MGGVFLPDTSRHVAIDYCQAFLLSGMADKRLEAVLPFRRYGIVGVSYNHHGNADYHEQQLALGYGIRATEWLRVGVAGRWMHLGVADAFYEPQQWLGADVIAALWPDRHTAVLLIAGTRPWDEEHSWYARVQAVYRPLPSWLTVVSVESSDCLRLRGGMEYTYQDVLFVRAGMSTNPMVFTCGLGVKEGALGLDLAVEVHRVLGITPSCSLRLWF